MNVECRVVDNRMFLLGLDDLYREAMKQHEREELLHCARDTASALSVAPAKTPIEGYYVEDEGLCEYFRLMRALQQVPKHRESELVSIAGYARLKEVIESPIFGPPVRGDFLLSGGEDSLSIALKETFPHWNIATLTDRAYREASTSDDVSLVALAALSRDPVILTALRESVVLYAVAVMGAAIVDEPEYIWRVDDAIQARAKQFVSEFNSLFDKSLPDPVATNARAYWGAFREVETLGRCVRIGSDDSTRPIKHYHWAIKRDSDGHLAVTDFWDTDVWTSARYSKEFEAQL